MLNGIIMTARETLRIVFLIGLTSIVHSSDILVVCGLTSRSEMSVFYPYSEALAERGHQVTLITPYTPKKPLRAGVTVIVPKELAEEAIGENAGPEMVEMKFTRPLDEWLMQDLMFEYAESLANALMIEAKEVKVLVNSGKKFDLMIINGALNDFALPLVHLYKCPFIYVDGSGTYPWHLPSTGSPLSTSYAPSIISDFGDTMSFWERASNTYRVLSWIYLKEKVLYPKLEKMLRPIYIKKDTPPLIEIDKNVSLVLSVRDLSLEYPRSYPPNVIHIGCVHCREPQPMPKDLMNYLDGSGEEGFVYFSFGSVVTMDVKKEFIKETFFKAISQLPRVRFLVKWETDATREEIGAPPNVKLMKWCPQQDVLGHPKIKAFISHSGLLSTLETVYHGVPVYAFPFFFDQEYNAGMAEQYGYGIKGDLVTITAEKILDALHRLLKDPSFHKNAKHHSRIFRDHPQPPMETAVYWAEFVMRHNGAPHLRPVSRYLPFYKIYLLDIALAIGMIFSLSSALLFVILRHVFRMMFASKSKRD